MSQENIAETVANRISDLQKPQLVELPSAPGAVSVLVVPKGKEVKSLKPLLDEYRIRPERIEGTAKLEELESFISHVNRFKLSESAVFGTRDNCQLTAVFDYHGKDPAFCRHTAVYTAPKSEPWDAWTAAAGRWMNQGEFAELIDERIMDLANPEVVDVEVKAMGERLEIEFATPAKLVELSRGLTLTQSFSVGNHADVNNGIATLIYSETHTEDDGRGGKQKVKVPSAFILEIPVFKGGTFCQVAARLRYKIQGGVVAWKVDLYRVDDILGEAFGLICAEVIKETGLPLFRGTPEPKR